MDEKVGYWLKVLLNGLDECTDEATKKKLLGGCGEKCPFSHLPDEKLYGIKEQSRSEEAFLEELCREWRLVREDGHYYVVFDQCYCPLVNTDLEGVSPSLCYCTLGNLERKFKIGTGRDVGVVMEKTILSGDNECRFRIEV